MAQQVFFTIEKGENKKNKKKKKPKVMWDVSVDDESSFMYYLHIKSTMEYYEL